jgi:hypothetical protein
MPPCQDLPFCTSLHRRALPPIEAHGLSYSCKGTKARPCSPCSPIPASVVFKSKALSRLYCTVEADHRCAVVSLSYFK